MKKTKKTKTSKQRIYDGVDAWASFYRANPHRFAEDYLNIHLRLFQKILLYLMNEVNYFCYIAARGWETRPLHLVISVNKAGEIGER